MAERYLIKDSQNRVVNIIRWDGVTPLALADGLTASIDRNKTRQIYAEPGPVTQTLEERLAKLEMDVRDIETRAVR